MTKVERLQKRVEILQLQKRVGAAIRAQLPEDWTYFCWVSDPKGKHYMLARMRQEDLAPWLKRLPKRVREAVELDQCY